MLTHQFLSCAENTSAGERAEAAGHLARAFLYAELDPIERGDMERALTWLLDDSSPLVRRTLAEALAGSADAPHHLVAALADDQIDIAVIVLARSPRLTDGELIDAAALGESPAQCAIAARPGLSAAVAGALAEIGSLDAVLVLCRNHAATLADVSVRRILERWGSDGDIREALGSRRDLGTGLRHELVVATAEALRAFVTARGWMAPERARRIAADETDRAALRLARDTLEAEGDLGLLRFAACLRRAGRLTPALVIRALLSGQLALFEAALAELSGQRLSRVSALVSGHDGLAFAALVRSAGFPDSLLPVLRTGLDARRPATVATQAPTTLRREIVARVLARCRPDGDRSPAGLTALLRRFEFEAARDEGRVDAPFRRSITAAARSEPERIEPSFDLVPDEVLDLASAA